jgi:uncharacterized protein (DUF3084 family)
MKAETNDMQAKAPESTPVQPEPTSKPDPTPAPVKPAKPQLGRFRRIWRTALIWLAVVAVAFLAGVLTFNFMRYKPLNETLTQTQGELMQANQNISELEAKLSAANNKVSALESDNQAIQSELDTANTHLELLQVLVDVSNARLALADGDVPAAKTALQNTSQRLESLAPRIAVVDTNLAESMPQRLTLILSGLGSDVETAKVDLELLTGNLLDAETALFGK